jgi:hypothetical protein
VTLIGEASLGSGFSQAYSLVTNKLDRPLQTEVHNVTMGSRSNRSGEHAGEVERAAPRDVCQLCDVDRLVEMRNYVIS